MIHTNHDKKINILTKNFKNGKQINMDVTKTKSKNKIIKNLMPNTNSSTIKVQKEMVGWRVLILIKSISSLKRPVKG